VTSSEDDIWRKRHQFRSVHAEAVGIARAPAGVDAHVAPIGPAQFLHRLQEPGEARLPLRIVHGRVHKHTDTPYALALLRARRERPRGRAADKRDELATLHLRNHSITSSASASNFGEISMPSAFAALRSITNSNLVGCNTGSSAGLVPLRILPV